MDAGSLTRIRMGQEILSCRDLTHAERLWVIHNAGLSDALDDSWRHARFLRDAGLSVEEAQRVVARDSSLSEPVPGSCSPRPGCSCCAYHDWLAEAGDHAWAGGDIAYAERLYRRCRSSVPYRDFVYRAGMRGLFRLLFYLGRNDEASEVFLTAAPEASWSDRLDAFLDSEKLDWDALARETEDSYPAAPGFLTSARYMCRSVIAALELAGRLDDAATGRVASYFDVKTEEVREVARSLDAEPEIAAKLREAVAPASLRNRAGSFNELLLSGESRAARQILHIFRKADGHLAGIRELLRNAAKSGHCPTLPQMHQNGLPFRSDQLDRALIELALGQEIEFIHSRPRGYLAIVRALAPDARFPHLDYPKRLAWALSASGLPITEGDVIEGILATNWWHSAGFAIDDTGPGMRPGFGKAEIARHRSWLETLLVAECWLASRSSPQTRSGAIELFHAAYRFLRRHYMQAKDERRWTSEAMLGAALEALFGNEHVEWHARPLWLHRQHLDFYLPAYRIAVEYMGEQHYRAVDFFGGAAGLRMTKERDERKRRASAAAGVDLFFVRFDEDIGARAEEIFAEVSGKQ